MLDLERSAHSARCVSMKNADPFHHRLQLRGILGGASNAAGGIGDIVLGETEQAEAMAELRVMLPDFSQEDFLDMIGREMGPEIIGAYLKGDMELIREQCRDQAFATLQASVVDRQTRQLRMDTRILHMSEPQLEGMRILAGYALSPSSQSPRLCIMLVWLTSSLCHPLLQATHCNSIVRNPSDILYSQRSDERDCRG